MAIIFSRIPCCNLLAVFLVTTIATGQEVDIATAYRLYEQGKFEECISACEKGIKNAWRVDWRLLKIRSEKSLGQYTVAMKSAEQALENHTGDIRIRWEARQVFQLNNELKKADEMISQVDSLVKNAPWRYSDAEDRIVLGQMMLEANADAKKVLELFFDTAKKIRPDLVDIYIVAADLALSKSDFGLAVKEAQTGLKRHPENAELHFRLARGLWDSDRKAAVMALNRTLEINPRHFEALFFQSELAIDSENYPEAHRILDSVLKVNPRQEIALALKAVLSHLAGEFATEKKVRQRALSSWPKNPRVDYTIGRKLSQKYRFREGAAYQKTALEMAPDFIPAKIQLAQDLLRLGRDEEGWKLVTEANQLDAYNVLMHNLQSLYDEISTYSSLEKDGIILRMSRKEASLYGPEVLRLLLDAKQKLTQKYDYQFDQPVIVEIFPRQEDFAIRTFGMPGGVGFLGVCFGHLITANSPASQASTPTNWKSVLWHEFCHAVTLGKTNNRMPRWLSEGISVYEERLRNPSSGENISPTYRQMMLSEDLTPVSQLSAAFLQAKSPVHLQFAYYESSLVVEYLIREYGLDTLKQILVDLGAGISINESLQRYTGSLDVLDRNFKKFATDIAEAYASKLDFSESDLEPTATVSQVRSFLAKSPLNFSANLQLAATLIGDQKFDEAVQILNELSEKFVTQVPHPIVLQLLVQAYKGKGDRSKEREILEKFLLVGDDHLEAYLRLSTIYAEDESWQKLLEINQKILAVNPLFPEAYRQLARAGEHLDDPETTSRALECLLEFENTDVALTHYRIAKIRLAQKNINDAKRHALYAIEEAPRFRDAHRLLLRIKTLEKTADPASPQPPGPPSASSGG